MIGHPSFGTNDLSGLQTQLFEFPCGDLCVKSDSSEIFLELEELTRYWETAFRLPERCEFTFTLRVRQPGENVPLPPKATLLYHNHLYPGVPLEYFGSDSRRIFRICGTDVVVADYELGVAQGVTALRSPHWKQQYVFDCVFVPPLIEWMGRHNVFVFHGGAVAWDEDGVVITGPSGSGKTTAVLSLALAGFDFLTDDIGLLFTGEELRVSGLSEPINLCPDAPRLFHQLKRFAPIFQDDSKRALPMEAVGGAQNRRWCRPRLLFFPMVDPDADVALVPIRRGEALELLIPNGMFLTGMREGSQRFMAFLQLLETTMPMRLILGRGMQRLPGLVKEAISRFKGPNGFSP